MMMLQNLYLCHLGLYLFEFDVARYVLCCAAATYVLIKKNYMPVFFLASCKHIQG